MRRLFIPSQIKDVLFMLTNFPIMTTGALITRWGETADIKYELAVSYYVLGAGDEATTAYNENRRRILYHLLDKHGTLKYIPTHTHSIATVRRFGEGYLYAPSPVAREEINKLVGDGKNYRHMVITPTRILLYGFNEEANAPGLLARFTSPSTIHGTDKLSVVDYDIATLHESIENLIKLTCKELELEAFSLPWEFKLGAGTTRDFELE